MVWHNELTAQTGTVTEQLTLLAASTRPGYSYYLAMSACLQQFVEVQSIKKLCFITCWNMSHLYQHPLNSKKKTYKK